MGKTRGSSRSKCVFGKRDKSLLFQQPSADVNSKIEKFKSWFYPRKNKKNCCCCTTRDFDRSSVSNMQLEVVSFPETLGKRWVWEWKTGCVTLKVVAARPRHSWPSDLLQPLRYPFFSPSFKQGRVTLGSSSLLFLLSYLLGVLKKEKKRKKIWGNFWILLNKITAEIEGGKKITQGGRKSWRFSKVRNRMKLVLRFVLSTLHH